LGTTLFFQGFPQNFDDFDEWIRFWIHQTFIKMFDRCANSLKPMH